MSPPSNSSSHPAGPNGRRVEAIRWDGLPPGSRQRWIELRATQAEFASPFFAWQFIDAVHAVRGDVEVIVVRDDEQIVGLLPFHRIHQIAYPVGRYLNDAHNILTSPGTPLDWVSILKSCDLVAFDFHALVGSTDHLMAGNIHGSTGAYAADLGDDSSDFLDRLSRTHRTIRKQPQKTRSMARSVGPLSLEFDCRDSEILNQTIAWKRQQYRRTNILDLFTPPWTRDLMQRLHQSHEDDTRGILSVLRAGDHVVAAHYGMIQPGLLHYWFPVYDPQYARYSPGTALFMHLVQSGTENGIGCIDMGYGEQPYKVKQTDTVTQVVHGCISRSAMHCRMLRLRKWATAKAKRAPMKEYLKSAVRRLHPDAGAGKLK